MQAESRINAQVVNKFTEEIEKLDKECTKSLESNKLEDGIKAKEAAEARVRDLEQELMLHKIQVTHFIWKWIYKVYHYRIKNNYIMYVIRKLWCTKTVTDKYSLVNL